MANRNPFSSAISGVLYAEDFDEPLLPREQPSAPARTSPVPEARPVVPSFTIEELRAAVEQSRAEGLAAGQAAAAAAQEAQHTLALEGLAEQLGRAREQAATMLECGLDALARTTLVMLAAALPALSARHGESEVRALLRRVLPPVRMMPELQIRLHPSLRPAIELEATALLGGAPGRLAWIECDTLARGDIAMTWRDGGAIRDSAAICAEIHAATIALLEPAPAEHPETDRGH